MTFWTFWALFFGLLALILGFFTLYPEWLMYLHQRLTGRDAVRELEGGHYSFLRVTRRACAVPMAICLVIALCFTKTAFNDARTREQREKYDAERMNKIRTQGVGSVYSQAWQQSQSAPRSAPEAGKKP